MDPIRRKILTTGAAATAMAAAPRMFAQQTGQGGTAMSFYEKGPVRIHYRGGRFRLPVVAHRRRGIELDDLRPDQSFNPIEEFKGRVPLHRVGPAQRQRRPVLRPARDRPAMGCLYR